MHPPCFKETSGLYRTPGSDFIQVSRVTSQYGTTFTKRWLQVPWTYRENADLIHVLLSHLTSQNGFRKCGLRIKQHLSVLGSLPGGMYPGHTELDLTSLPGAGQFLGSENVREE